MTVRLVTITVSDTRTCDNDVSGEVLSAELAAFFLVRHVRVSDDLERIQQEVRACVSAGDIDAVVLTGGTGLSPRDVTYEAVAPLLTKTLDGFGEAFRRLSWEEVGPRSILSRATAGSVGSCLVFVLPGSPKAVRLAARALIAPVLAHAVDIAHGRTKHGGA